jgi:hypothetical protein
MEKGNKATQPPAKRSTLDASYAKWDAYFRSDSKELAKDLNVTLGKPLTEDEFLRLKKGSKEKFTVLGR